MRSKWPTENQTDIKNAYTLWLLGLDFKYKGHTVLSKSFISTMTIEFIDSSASEFIVRNYYTSNHYSKTLYQNDNAYLLELGNIP